MNFEYLVGALSAMFQETVSSADCQMEQLQGGTVAEVSLLTGTAVMANGTTKDYRLVWKVQKKWERYADPGSWRREYDLYQSRLSELFAPELRWPHCFYAVMNEERNEFQLFLEYMEGISGASMTLPMYRRSAYELGRFQGRLYALKPACLQEITNLSDAGFMQRFYLHYRSWNVVYDYVRSKDCALPESFCDMLIDLDVTSQKVFERLGQLPTVLCHRDFWVTNLLCSDAGIGLIDWDTAGYGVMGEDIASLIADESDVTLMPELYVECTRAYYEGFSEFYDVSSITDDCILEMILMKFGYRLVEQYLELMQEEKEEEAAEERRIVLTTMEQIARMRA